MSVHIKKIKVIQIAKKFAALNGIRKFIIVFTRVCHLSLS